MFFPNRCSLPPFKKKKSVHTRNSQKHWGKKITLSSKTNAISLCGQVMKWACCYSESPGKYHKRQFSGNMVSRECSFHESTGTCEK